MYSLDQVTGNSDGENQIGRDKVILTQLCDCVKLMVCVVCGGEDSNSFISIFDVFWKENTQRWPDIRQEAKSSVYDCCLRSPQDVQKMPRTSV
jgi:hypothetical protein